MPASLLLSPCSVCCCFGDDAIGCKATYTRPYVFLLAGGTLPRSSPPCTTCGQSKRDNSIYLATALMVNVCAVVLVGSIAVFMNFQKLLSGER